MSAKEKMKEMANTISDKTKEYAPIVKDKILIAYHKTKNFSINVVIPKIKSGADHIKEKIEDWQKNKQAAKANTTSPKATVSTEHKQPEHKKHQNHL
jgi:hypothetical protein